MRGVVYGNGIHAGARIQVARDTGSIIYAHRINTSSHIYVALDGGCIQAEVIVVATHRIRAGSQHNGSRYSRALAELNHIRPCPGADRGGDFCAFADQSVVAIQAIAITTEAQGGAGAANAGIGKGDNVGAGAGGDAARDHRLAAAAGTSDDQRVGSIEAIGVGSERDVVADRGCIEHAHRIGTAAGVHCTGNAGSIERKHIIAVAGVVVGTERYRTTHLGALAECHRIGGRTRADCPVHITAFGGDCVYPCATAVGADRRTGVSDGEGIDAVAGCHRARHGATIDGEGVVAGAGVDRPNGTGTAGHIHFVGGTFTQIQSARERATTGHTHLIDPGG